MAEMRTWEDIFTEHGIQIIKRVAPWSKDVDVRLNIPASGTLTIEAAKKHIEHVQAAIAQAEALAADAATASGEAKE